MPGYTLTYFDLSGRAQTSRYLFLAAGIDFEDRRLTKEQWQELKPNTPLGQVPILDVEGRDTICQGLAIERYIARKAGLAGKTDEEAVIVDQVHTTLAEAGGILLPFFFGAPAEPDAKEALRKTIVEEKLPVFVDFLNRVFEKNGGGDGYLVGSSMTLADIAFANASSYLKQVDTEGVFAAKYPKLYALADRVLALPAIKAYNEKH